MAKISIEIRANRTQSYKNLKEDLTAIIDRINKHPPKVVLNANKSLSYNGIRNDLKDIIARVNKNPPKIKIDLDQKYLAKQFKSIGIAAPNGTGNQANQKNTGSKSQDKILKGTIAFDRILSKIDSKLTRMYKSERQYAPALEGRDGSASKEAVKSFGRQRAFLRKAKSDLFSENLSKEDIDKIFAQSDRDYESALYKASRVGKDDKNLLKIKKDTKEYNDALSETRSQMLSIISARNKFVKDGGSKTSDEYLHLEELIVKLRDLESGIKSGETSYDSFKTRLSGIREEFSGIKVDVSVANTAIAQGQQLIKKNTDEYNKAANQINTLRDSISKDVANWNFAGLDGSSVKEEYGQLQGQLSELDSLFENLKNGNLTLDEFNRRISNIRSSYIDLSNAIVSSGNNQKVLSEGTKEYSDTLTKINRQILSVRSARDKYIKDGGDKSDATYGRFNDILSGYGNLKQQITGGKVSTVEIDSITARLQRDFAELRLTANEAFGDIAKGQAKIVSGTEEYSRSVKQVNSLMTTLSRNMKNWSAAKEGAAKEQYALLQQKYNELEGLLGELGTGNLSKDDYALRIANIKADIAEAERIITQLGEATKGNDAVKEALEYSNELSRIRTLLMQITDAEKKWTAAKNGKSKEDYKELGKLKENLSGFLSNIISKGTINKEDIGELTQYSTKFKEISQHIKDNNEATLSWKDRLGSLAEKFNVWYSLTRVLTFIHKSITQIVKSVIELDTAMTELKKVTNESDSTYEKFLNNASTRAQNLGISLSDVVRATADFARLGYNIGDAEKLSDAAVIYKNVGDGISDINTASESIIATMQAFGIGASDAMSIVDKFNEVGNNYAISSKGVGDALMRSAAAMKAANNTLDETIALAAAANTVIQDPDKVGTTLKTISMYLRAAKTEAEEAGESTDGMASSVSKLRDELLSLTGGKVDIRLDENTFKSTFQIMKELSGVWSELTDMSQANILEKIGGKRNANVVAALLENFSLAENALITSANSAGSALAENEKVIDSVQGKLNILKSVFETLSKNLIEGDLIKFFIDAATGVLQLANAIAVGIDKIGGLRAVIVAVTASLLIFKAEAIASMLAVIRTFAVEKIPAFFNLISTGISSIIPKLYDAVLAWQLYASGQATAAAATQFILPGIGVLLAAISLVTLGVYKWNESIEKNNEAIRNSIKEWDSVSKTIQGNIQDLKSLKGEFDKLSDGVDENGNNIALTAEQYERYKEIISRISEIAPELIAKYGEENVYLEDKNKLLERAIELQDQEYKNELRKMTSMKYMTEAMKKYLPAYDAAYGSEEVDTAGGYGSSTKELKSSVEKMYKLGGITDKKEYIKSIMSVIGIKDIDKELEAYTMPTGLISATQFWVEHADAISENIDTIASRITPLENKADAFKTAVEKAGSAAIKYQDIIGAAQQSNVELTKQLSLVAEYNDRFSDLNNASKNFVTNFISQFKTKDVTERRLGVLVPSEEKISSIKYQINNLIDNLTPEIQKSLAKLSEIDISKTSAQEWQSQVQSTIDNIAKELSLNDADKQKLMIAVGFEYTDDGITTVEHMLNTVRDALGVDNNYELSLNYEDLKKAYQIIQDLGTDGISSFDDLLEKIKEFNYATADMVNPLDFSNLTGNLESAVDGFSSIIDAMARLKDGTALTKSELAQLALEYPKLLEAANLFTDGSVEGQQNMLNSILGIKEAEYDSEIDVKIRELEATEKVLNQQLALEEQKANIIQEIKNYETNGLLEQEGDLVSKISELNDLQGQNYVSMENGILTVNQEALNDNIEQQSDFGEKSEENIWQPFGDVIVESFRQASSNSLGVINRLGSKIFQAVKKIGNLFTGLGNAVVAVFHGDIAGALGAIKDTFGAGVDTNVDATPVDLSFKGSPVTVDGKSLDEWVSEQEEASKERISKIEEFKAKTVTAIDNLKALKGLDLHEIYGKAGSDKGKGSGGGGGSKDKGSDSSKQIEEYIVDVERYAEALQKLHDIEVKQSNLERDLNNAESAIEKVRIQKSLIQIYKERQDALHELNNLRDETINNTIPALQSLGFQIEYNDEINRLFIANMEHLNELQADSAGEYETIQEATNALRKDTEELIKDITNLNEENEQSSETWLNLADSISSSKESIISDLNEIVSEAIDFVDSIQSYYSTLQSASEEYAEKGALSVNSLKAIAEYGAEYMTYLKDENGMLSINKERIEDVIVARTKQLAVDTALSYVEKLRFALSENNVSELNKLITGTEKASEATWELVYSNLALLDLNGEQYNLALENINRIRSLGEEAAKSVRLGGERSATQYVSANDALNKILDLTMDLIKYETEQRVEGLEKQIDKYKEIIDLKKESLNSTKNENDYNKTVAKKLKEISQLQSRINQLSLDDSREAQAERISLEEQLSELQEDLADYQADYSIDKQSEMLDDMADSYEKEKNKEIEAAKESISSQEKLYRLAIDRINTDWDNLYSDIINWNYEAGSTIESEIVDAWEQASKAVQEYGSFVDAVNKSAAGISPDGDMTVGSSTKYEDPEKIKKAMRNNSLKWFAASESEQRGLENQNKAYANQLSSIYEKEVSPEDGSWYVEGSSKPLYTISKEEAVSYIVSKMKANSSNWTVGRDDLAKANQDLAARIANITNRQVRRDNDGVWWIGNENLYERYHTGGVIGNSDLKKDEVMAILKDGELVLDEQREKALYKIVDFAEILSAKLGKTINTDRLDNIFTSTPLLTALSDSRPSSTRTGSESFEFNPTITVNINNPGDLSERKAEEYGHIAANAALSELRGAFTKIGITNIGNSALK